MSAPTFLPGLIPESWRHDWDGPARASVTFAGALASANAVVTSLATAAAPVTLTGAGLTGTTAGTFTAPRTVSVTTAASVGSYSIGVPNAITVIGTDYLGFAIQDTLVLTATGGGETITSTKAFLAVTEIDLPAQVDTSGHWTFGVRDVMLPAPVSRVMAGTSASANLHLGYDSGVKDTILKVPAGVPLPLSPRWIYSDSTASDISVWF